MTYPRNRTSASLAVLSLALFASSAHADPLPGRDLLKFSQLPMVSTPIADPIINPNPNSFAPVGLPIGGITNYGGHDEVSTLYGNHGPFPTDVPGQYTGRFMADDFSDKLNSPVVHVKWWGSYFADYQPEPVNQFLISFESDQPADATNSFSHPAQPLLNQVVNRGALAPGSGTFTEKLVRGPDPVRHESLYEYNAELYLDKPFPEKADNVYWLKIAAMVDVYPGFDNFNHFDPEHPPLFTGDHPTIWGWHNRDYTIQDTLASSAVSPGEHLDGTIDGSPIYHFQDDAVTGNAIVDMTTSGGRIVPGVLQSSMSPTFYLNGADGPAGAAGAIGIGNYSKDLAFQLFTTQVPEPATCVLFAVGCAGVVSMRNRLSHGRRSRLFLGSLLVVALVVGSTAKSYGTTIVFDNIAPSPQYYFNFGNWSGSLTPNTYAISAMNFTPSASGALDELDLGYTDQKIVNTVNATLRLSPEVAGMPSAPIWTGSVLPTGTFGQLTSVTSIGGPMLAAGQTYWLEAFPPNDGTTLHGWYTNNQGDVGSIIGNGNAIANTPRFALRVGVNSVPEPSSLALAVFGLAATGCFANWLRRGPSTVAVTSRKTNRRRSAQSPARSGSRCTTPPSNCGRAAKGRESSPQSGR